MSLLTAIEPLLLEFLIEELQYAKASHENQMERDPSFSEAAYKRTRGRIRQIDALVEVMQAQIDAL